MSRTKSTTRLRTVTVFAPVPEEALAELTVRLRDLKDAPSPFAAVPGTHFARLAVLGRDEFRPQPRPRGMRRAAVLIDLLTHGGRPQRPDPPSRSYLLFSANYDGPAAAIDDVAYLDGLRQRLTGDADHLFGLCSDYPGWADRAGFLAFFAERSRPARYLFSASDAEPTVERIRAALHRRRQVIELAVETDGQPDADLVAHLRKTFGTTVDGTLDGTSGGTSDGTSDGTEQTGAQLPARTSAEPALVDPPTGVELLADADRAPATDPDLDDVQNLVVSGYPRHESARHLLLRITDPAAARRWLARVTAAIPSAGWAGDEVDRLDYETVERTAVSSEIKHGAPGFAAHVALSHTGLTRLGLPESELAGFSSEFRAGMASREAGLAPGRGTQPWQAPFADHPSVDVLVMFSATDPAGLDSELTDRPGLLPGADDGVQVLQTLEAGRIRADRDDTAKPGFLEHFGFADGLSQPRVHGVTPGRRVAELPAGEALLGYEDIDGDTAGAGLPAALARNGSYLVYRKLEQDVPAFRALTRELGDRLEGRAPAGTDREELAAAKLMGRWRDGTPLTASPGGRDAGVHRGEFGFQANDAEGHGCPVGAHIRRANPRDSRPVDPNPGADTGGEAGLEATLTQRHRMLRRGIPYGTPLPPDAETGRDERGLADGSPAAGHETDRGLLFIALVGDLRRQFEFVQAHWMADGNAFRLGADRDVLSGATEEGNKFVVQGTPPTFVQPSTPLVTCRGGEYFFLPGLTALKALSSPR